LGSDTDDPIPVKPPASLSEREMSVPARKGKVSGAPIVQAGSVTGRSLTLVIAIMCFLACLTSGIVYMVNQSAAAWLRNIASEVSVQVEPKQTVEETEAVVAKVIEHLKSDPGVVEARALTLDESTELLEPWLGQSDALKNLPMIIPRLIAIELNRRNPPDLETIREELAQEFPDAVLDDHRHWQSQIRTVTRSMALAGLAILGLVAAATTAIIVSATRSAMASNREIVEVLHFVGATDRFIAREFEKHFLTLGVRAGLVGAISAAFVFLVVPWIVPLMGGGGAIADAETRNLINGGTLDLPGFALLGIVVIVVAALCMLTSRYGVFRILHLKD
jgi:cell division transport system permease protein